MNNINVNINDNEIEHSLNEMFSPDWIRDAATRTSFVKRQRKIDSVAFFWVVVLGFGVGAQRTLASLRRAYKTATASKIVPSSFYDRFSTGLIDFLKECITHGVVELSKHTSLTLSDKLKGFNDLIVTDGTIVRLHEKLANVFPGTRGKAELKIHVATGITSNTKSMTIYSGKTADAKTMRIGPWVKNNILLFDLGYYKYEMFGKIIKNGGYFVSRLKDNSNPTIVSVFHSYEGNADDFAGKKLKEILPNLKEKVIDLKVEVSFKSKAYKDPNDTFEVYHPRGSEPKAKASLRLVGILDEETNKYHFYLTNIKPEQLTAKDVALLYGARWSIELMFKELKSLYKLDVISSGASIIVESLVLMAMLTLLVSQRILNHMRLLAPDKISHMTNLRWAESFFAVAPIIMSKVLKVAGVEEDPVMLMIYFMSEGVDPNINREPLMTQWVAPVNSQGIN